MSLESVCLNGFLCLFDDNLCVEPFSLTRVFLIVALRCSGEAEGVKKRPDFVSKEKDREEKIEKSISQESRPKGSINNSTTASSEVTVQWNGNEDRSARIVVTANQSAQEVWFSVFLVLLLWIPSCSCFLFVLFREVRDLI